MAPDSLVAVHPLSFRLDALRRQAERQMDRTGGCEGMAVMSRRSDDPDTGYLAKASEGRG